MAALPNSTNTNTVVNPDPERLLGLPPLVDARTRVLVLGSFPGVASLRAQQYYAHPRNQFWPVLQAILAPMARPAWFVSYDGFEAEMPTDYAGRCAWLLAHGVGLWDVYASCQRQGSLDAAIRHPQLNDWASLSSLCPHLALVAHNGAESHRHAHHMHPLTVPVVRLPSTSPANASWSFERKSEAWMAALAPVLTAPVAAAVPKFAEG